MILLVSLFYPVFFAYIDRNNSISSLVIEFIFTAARLSVITLVVYGVIRLNNLLFAKVAVYWVRYILELLIILFTCYWFLYAFVAFIDSPLTGSNPADPSLWTFRRYIGLYMLATIFIYMFMTALNIFQVARQKEALSEQLQREYAQVRLQALKSQVNPHFLFNSLSVLSSLVHVDPELSEKFIHQLAKAYRYILEQKELELVSLQEEIGFLDAYFFLLQIRFENKVRLEKNIPPGYLSYKLPPLTLQLLMENAVKHNKMSAQDPLIIQLVIHDGQLIIENNVSHRDQPESSTGIGLENIMRRYAMVSNEKPVVSNDGNQFIVTIPLIKP